MAHINELPQNHLWIYPLWPFWTFPDLTPHLYAFNSPTHTHTHTHTHTKQPDCVAQSDCFSRSAEWPNRYQPFLQAACKTKCIPNQWQVTAYSVLRHRAQDTWWSKHHFDFTFYFDISHSHRTCKYYVVLYTVILLKGYSKNCNIVKYYYNLK